MHRSRRPQAQRLEVRRGGIALVLREVESGVLAAIPMAMPDLVRPVGIIHRRQKLLTPTAQTLLEFLQSQKQ